MFCKEVDDSVFKPTMDLFELLIDGPRMLLSLKTWVKKHDKNMQKHHWRFNHIYIDSFSPSGKPTYFLQNLDTYEPVTFSLF